jgi:hypothetical protein
MRCQTAGVVIAILLASQVQAIAACEAWTSYKGVDLHRFDGGKTYAYRTARIEIDADGAPNAYEPHDRGLDALANAGFPNGGWRSVLVTDPDDRSKPFVQNSGEFAGFFLSMTTLEDPSKASTDPARYVDARAVPYVVFPGQFFRMSGTGRRGVIGMARNLSSAQTSPMIFADLGGGADELGEISIRLAENLGGHDVNPRNASGAPHGPFAYVVFPGSEATPPWPVSDDELKQRGEAELTKIGGWDAVLSCLGAN